MKIAKTTYGSAPNALVEGAFDCLWLCLSRPADTQPLRQPPLQHLDWQLGGVIGRFFAEPGRGKDNPPTFIPTMKKVPSQFLVIDTANTFAASSFLKNCGGQQWKKILIYCEDPLRVNEVEKALSPKKSDELAIEITLATGST